MENEPVKDNGQLTIVAVHGNGGSAGRFRLVVPHIPAGITFQPITLPGFGGRPADPSLRSLADYAHYLAGMVTDLPRPVILYGTGIGGSLVLQYAQQAQADGLILHAPVGASLDRRWLPRFMSRPGLRRLAQRLFASHLLRPFWRRLVFRQPLAAGVINSFFDEYGQCQVFGQMFEMLTPAWFNSLSPITRPAALLWGGRERVLGVEQLADYQRLLPQAIVRVVPDWDHFPMLEQPAEFAAELGQLSQRLLQYGRGQTSQSSR